MTASCYRLAGGKGVSNQARDSTDFLRNIVRDFNGEINLVNGEISFSAKIQIL